MNPGFLSYTYGMEATMGSTNHGYNVDDETAVGIFQKDDDGFCDFVACRQLDMYLENDGDGSSRPFLAFIGINSPHPPLYPPRKYAESTIGNASSCLRSIRRRPPPNRRSMESHGSDGDI